MHFVNQNLKPVGHSVPKTNDVPQSTDALQRSRDTKWKYESVTDRQTYQPTNLLTGVGFRDACASKNIHNLSGRQIVF